LDGASKKHGVGSKILPSLNVMARIHSVETDVDQASQSIPRQDQDHEAREKELDEKYELSWMSSSILTA